MKPVVVLAALALAASRADAKGCREVSDVVGFEHCKSFGAWSPDDPGAITLWVELGGLTEQFVAPDSGGANHTMIGFTIPMRVLYGIRRWLYVGGELGIGDIFDAQALAPGPMPVTTSVFVTLHAIAGVHTRVWRFGLGTELAGGLRAHDASTCIDKACSAGMDVGQTRAGIDARLRVDYFVTDMFSIGATIGNGVFEPSDHEVMLVFGVHARAIDGM